MQSEARSRAPLGQRQEGIALIVTLMVLMLVSILMVGFVAAIIADTRASGLDRDQTQAYAAAHAGLEQITSDLSALFATDFSPSTAQINALTTNPPTLTGFTFVAPGGASGSGYAVAPRFTSGGNPAPEDPINGSTITSGPYQGFRGIITPYDITVTARSRGGAEVRMRRTLQTVAIPVFQFGMFSETDLAFHAGADGFTFGGRVHTNGNLFLSQADGGTLTITDRITALQQIVRTHLPNGLPIGSGYAGTIRIPTLVASNPASNAYRNLASNEGSITGTVPPTQVPQASANPNWTKLSVGTYASNIRNGDTGAKRLDLPIVADLNGDGVPDAQPIELIRRPAPGEAVALPFIYQQRFYSQAAIRILLSDESADLTGLPGNVAASVPVALAGGVAYTTSGNAALRAPLAQSSLTPTLADGPLPASIYKSTGWPLVGGFIKIEVQRTDLTWADVTNEVLGLGIAGRNLADADIDTPSTFPITTSGSPLRGAWNRPPASAADTCVEPNPDAIVRLQRVRDVPFLATGATPSLANRCGVTFSAGTTVNGVSGRATDYWPMALYDTREGQVRDGLTTTSLSMGGVMQYVELDVNNLRRWLAGTIGTTGNQVRNDNGYIVYFSDRRGNANAAGNETGEYGYEDIVNVNTSLDTGEDVNGNGARDMYGATPRYDGTALNLMPLTMFSPYINGTAHPTFQISSATAGMAALTARANRTLFFRRALKLVNGTLGNLPLGLTVVAENPVYVQGNYNATDTSVLATTNVPAAIIADAVTLLSNNWNDMRSFTSPSDSTQRDATTTGFRMAIVTGKGIAFPQPAGTDASFGSDGGTHNFMRSLEDWGPVTHRYRGSLVSFFVNRQGTGTFKCCDQDAYNRGTRDWSFDTDFLLPSRLPPGTPMFRDVNTLTFRQLLRPTQ